MNNNQPLSILTAITAIAFLAFSGPSQAQDTEEQTDTSQPLFESHELLDVRIEAPLSTLLKERPEEEYLDGAFFYSKADGSEQKLDLKLRTRGRYRRQKSTCNFPPVRLNFRKGQVEETLFANQDRLKLVTHCQTRRGQYEQLVLKEYLAYRILMMMTDYSFSARLMRINWVDTEGRDPLVRYGFVIEDDDNIGGRVGLEKSPKTQLSYSELNPAHTNLVNVFAFMIGNTDYSLIRGPADDDCCHNSVPFTDGTILYSIPYDLDFSGLVDAPYAEPNPQFKIRSVRTRVYRGRCSNNDVLPATLAQFQEKKDEIYAVINELPGLDDRNRKQATTYLDTFYDLISDAKRSDRAFIRGCS